jgi:branched-subunit amino acid transport protein AzlD
MSLWPTVVIGILGTYAEKLLGFLVPAAWLANPAFRRITEALPLGLLGALVAVQTLADGQSIVVDGRLVGLAVGALALRLRATFVVVVLAAALVTALGRAAGVLA